MNEKERFWNKVEKTDGCWIWLANKDQKGYGNFGINRKLHKAHRIVWEWLFGPIPDGLCICHHCDNPSCVNPTHLFIGTHRDNVMDAMKKGRHKIPDADNRGSRNFSAKLTEQQVLEIRRRYAGGGISQKKLAREYSVGQHTISDIVTKKSWKHI